MKKTSILILIMMIMLGTGFVFSVPDIHADTQGEQEIKFNITIDEALKEKNKHTITVSDEQVYQVGKNGILVIDIFSEEDYKIYLSEKQMLHLINQNAILQVHRSGFILNIPVTAVAKNQSLRLIMEQLDKNPDTPPSLNMAVGAVYDVTLELGDQIQNLFEYDIKLSFPVSNHDNPEELRVFYWNEDTREWELIGGEYKDDGYIHATTNHFSTFAVFHPDALAEQAERGDKGDEENNESINGKQNDQEGTGLPKTGTNTYNFLVTGIFLLLLGGLFYCLYRRLKTNTKHI